MRKDPVEQLKLLERTWDLTATGVEANCHVQDYLSQTNWALVAPLFTPLSAMALGVQIGLKLSLIPGPENDND